MIRVLAIDLQRIFANGPWGAPRFDAIVGNARALVDALPATFTRFVAPALPAGSWADYYEQWSFALQPADAPDYQLVDAFAEHRDATIDATTFGKWPAVQRALAPTPGDRFVVCGVSTDCRVLATVLAAADAGMTVQIVTDACAGATDQTHRAALDVMALYAPQVELVTTRDVLAAA